MASRIDAELQERIENFAHEITGLLKRAVADSVAEALTGTAARRGGGRGGRGGKLPPPSRRAGGRAVEASELLKELQKRTDQRMEELAKSLKTTTGALKAPMKKLIDEKQVKSVGQARGTKYRIAK